MEGTEKRVLQEPGRIPGGLRGQVEVDSVYRV